MRVEVVIVHHRGGPRLLRTLASLHTQTLPPSHIRVIDDGSGDGSMAAVARAYPHVEVTVLSPGAGKPSVGRNLGLAEADAPLVMLLDHDVALEADALARLAAVFAADESVAAAGPLLCYDREPDAAGAEDVIYLGLSTLHHLGVSSGGQRDLPAADHAPARPVRSLPGGNMMWRRDVAQALGGFDTGYAFGWGEDGELAVRAQLAGWRTLLVPAARGFHEHRPRGRARGEAQYYNRLRLLATTVNARTALLLLPAWLAFEAALFVCGLRTGCARLQARAWRRLLRDQHDITTRRRAVQATRRVGDAALLDAESLMQDAKRGGPGLLARVEPLITRALALHWRAASRLMRRVDMQPPRAEPLHLPDGPIGTRSADDAGQPNTASTEASVAA